MIANRRRAGKLLWAVLAGVLLWAAGAGVAAAQQGGERAGQTTGDTVTIRWDICLGAALSVGLACLAAGYAIGQVGAAALGAASERPELLTRSVVFVALGEGLVVFGFLIALVMVLQL